jgi:drug/metabolite transporter (DMT)-like permease
VGYALQKRGVDRIRDLSTGRTQGVRDYLTNRTWLLGQAFPFMGMALLIAAYAFGPVSTLMPLMGVGLVVLAFFCRFYLKESIRPLEWLAIGMSVGGLALMNVPEAAGSAASAAPALNIPDMARRVARPGSLAFLLAPNVLILGLVTYSALTGWRHSGSLFGVGAGIVGGTALLFQKPMSVGLRIVLDGGATDRLFFVALSSFLMIFLSVAAIAAANIGYNHGRGVLVAPLYSVFQMLFPTLGGAVVYGEWRGLPWEVILARALGIVVILVSMAILALYNELKLSRRPMPHTGTDP